MTVLSTQLAISRLLENEERFDKFANAEGNYIAKTGEVVETIRSFLARKNLELNNLVGIAANQTEEDALVILGYCIVLRSDIYTGPVSGFNVTPTSTIIFNGFVETVAPIPNVTPTSTIIFENFS